MAEIAGNAEPRNQEIRSMTLMKRASETRAAAIFGPLSFPLSMRLYTRGAGIGEVFGLPNEALKFLVLLENRAVREITRARFFFLQRFPDIRSEGTEERMVSTSLNVRGKGRHAVESKYPYIDGTVRRKVEDNSPLRSLRRIDFGLYNRSWFT